MAHKTIHNISATGADDICITLRHLIKHKEVTFCHIKTRLLKDSITTKHSSRLPVESKNITRHILSRLSVVMLKKLLRQHMSIYILEQQHATLCFITVSKSLA